METTHDVRIWKIELYRGSRKTTYRVRWLLGPKKFGETFAGSAMADSFRSQLVSAMARGEAFDVATGLPLSMLRAKAVMPWLSLVCAYIDANWPDWSPNHRKHTTHNLVRVTENMMLDGAFRPDDATLRKALTLNVNRTTRTTEKSDAVNDALGWAERQTRPVGDLADPELLRTVLQALDINLDGSRAAQDTVRLRRIALSGSIEFAVELGLLDHNPMSDLKVKKRRQTVHQVDPRSVVNVIQGRMLIAAVPTIGKSGKRLHAFFGCLYYAALRPEEACALKKENLSLPEPTWNEEAEKFEYGWGSLYVERARPEVDASWTDSGEASEEKSLKHREDNTGRTVPCPPELTELLYNHLDAFGVAQDGRMFRGSREGGRLGSTVYGRAWVKVREAVFTPPVVAGPLGKRPYDLRHAGVSTWLTGGVEPPRVAEWAGHSLSVLMNVYAKVLDGGEQAARDRVAKILGGN